MKIMLHQGDLPDGLNLGPIVAIDTETLGLNPFRDRLCLAQQRSQCVARVIENVEKATHRPAPRVCDLRSPVRALVLHCELQERCGFELGDRLV